MKARLKLIAFFILTEWYLLVRSQSLNKPPAISNLWEEKKKSLLCRFFVLILFHFTSRPLDIPQQDLIKLCSLFTNSVRRQKEKSNSLQRSGTLFSFFLSFFHILFEMWQEQNIPREYDGAQHPAMYTWPSFLNYLLSASPLKKAGRILYVPSHDSYKAIPVVWFSQLSFNALVVCPLISPLVWVCLSIHKKIQLDLWQLCRKKRWHFSKTKFIDKGWIYLSWNVYVVCLISLSLTALEGRQFHMFCS